MSNAFKDVIAKLAVIGQNPYKLVDCSEVILDPMPASGNPATFPTTQKQTDVEVAAMQFPSRPSALTPVQQVLSSLTNCMPVRRPLRRLSTPGPACFQGRAWNSTSPGPFRPTPSPGF
ncbi:hypothetical protein JB92DRAFT_1161056 [Gautieria morchelliformis]|nr:hypothetical protein JB92DRAFT_1161056 [Gautieria morchelliformis]